ncbi:hypothetical protein GLE_3098 [Lysobacter enzymogenes]|uniref:Uncharacterized protein n=1 Tax=Lysobacter enzymogenes TaxID=69 RepID=A0A0S2DJ70_LYSEN|nr:hypothetical protein [Lysobacter enzymogenes]ALN58445.1 hypothetical protein GLE_3098 [Lysobacter enzymogenes]QCW26827.1 hypothetical protein FE772_15435 [Lysobacter enzymogenes]
MAIASKGSRRIVVDGQAYRWAVRSRPTYTQGLGAPLAFAVQQVGAGEGQILHVVAAAARPDHWLGEPVATIAPAQVAAAIRLGLEAGWTPAAPGSAFELRLLAQ